MGLLEALSLAGRVLFRPQEKYHLLFPPQGEGFLGLSAETTRLPSPGRVCLAAPPDPVPAAALAHGCQACTPGSQGIPLHATLISRLEGGSCAVRNGAQAPSSPTHGTFSRTFSLSQDICCSISLCPPPPMSPWPNCLSMPGSVSK